MKNFICLFSLIWLTSCGGNSTAPLEPKPEFAVRQSDHYYLAGEVLGFSRTRAENFPTTGSASFEGSSQILISPVENDGYYFVIADSHIVADFVSAREAGSITGSLDNFIVRHIDGNGDREFYEANGAINIGGVESSIGDDDGVDGYTPYVFGTDFEGFVQTPEGGIRVIGDLSGQLNGNRVGLPEGEPVVKGLYATGVGRGWQNGERVNVDLEVTGIAVR